MSVASNSYDCVAQSVPSSAPDYRQIIELDDSQAFTLADAVYPADHPSNAGQAATIPADAVGARYTLLSASSSFVRYSLSGQSGFAQGDQLGSLGGEILLGYAGDNATALADLEQGLLRQINFHVNSSGETAVVQIEYAPNACSQ